MANRKRPIRLKFRVTEAEKSSRNEWHRRELITRKHISERWPSMAMLLIWRFPVSRSSLPMSAASPLHFSLCLFHIVIYHTHNYAHTYTLILHSIFSSIYLASHWYMIHYTPYYPLLLGCIPNTHQKIQQMHLSKIQ